MKGFQLRLPEELLKKFLSQSSHNQHQDHKYSSLLSISFLLDDPRKHHAAGEEKLSSAVFGEYSAFCRTVITQCSASVGSGLHAAHSHGSFGSAKGHPTTASTSALQFKTIQLSSSGFMQNLIRPLVSGIINLFILFFI
jgi:hypothetical protein